MNQQLLNVPSPCRQVCQLDASHVCIGCGRSIDEIAEWGAASMQRKLEIFNLARTRYSQLSQLQDQQ